MTCCNCLSSPVARPDAIFCQACIEANPELDAATITDEQFEQLLRTLAEMPVDT